MLTLEMKITDLPQFNYLLDLITRYQDQLPKAMVEEINAISKLDLRSKESFCTAG